MKKKNQFEKKMKVALVGSTGFVGGYIKRIFPTAICFHSKNIQDIENQTFDIVFCCGVSAVKYLANQNPEKDAADIQNLVSHLKTIHCTQKFVLISTIDVYDIYFKQSIQNEKAIQSQQFEPYGKHRYELELQLKSIFNSKLLIVRLGALFGFGLKKNLLFDIIARKKITVNRKSCFQWYNMEWFEQDLNYLMNKCENINEVNLFVEPLSNEELLTELNLGNDDLIVYTDANEMKYDIHTLYSQNNTHYWRSKSASLHAIKRFMKKSMNDTNVVVSSLTGVHPTNPYNVRNIEIAPFSYFGADFMDKPLEYFDVYKSSSIYSFQSIFYPFKWKLDQDFNLILAYLYKLIDIAIRIGVKILVFGSPVLRSVPNAAVLMTDLLTKCNAHINSRDVYICLEPNARHYNCNFLTNANDTFEFVSNLALANIKMMLDTGNMYLESETENTLFKYASHIQHVHFSAPNLIALNKWPEHFAYNLLRERLIRLGYKHKFTIECLNISYEDLCNSLYLILKDIDFRIVGAGWFGCSIAHELVEKGYNVELIEKNNHIFGNVSSHNQNRLHLGFHYPRSFNTRELCQRNYHEFLEKYGSFVEFIDDNCYYVSNESCMDFETYKQIMTAHNLPFKQVATNTDKLHFVYDQCFNVKEGIIDFRKVATFFSQTLERFIQLETMFEYASSNQKKWILDCSYNELKQITNTRFEPSISLVYKQRDMGSPPTAITVMDGGFFSLYPYDLKNRLYTLTHVALGRTSDFDLQAIQNDVMRYYPDFLMDFQFQWFFESKKCLLESSCASREAKIRHNDNVTSVVCGKITGIFDFVSAVTSLLV